MDSFQNGDRNRFQLLKSQESNSFFQQNKQSSIIHQLKFTVKFIFQSLENVNHRIAIARSKKCQQFQQGIAFRVAQGKSTLQISDGFPWIFPHFFA